MAGFYSSPEWVALRRQALERDHWRCVFCHASLHGLGRSRVDHIEPRSVRPELALVLANLRSLCPPCDNARHAEKGGAPGHALAGAGPDGWPTAPGHPWNRKPYVINRTNEPNERRTVRVRGGQQGGECAK